MYTEVHLDVFDYQKKEIKSDQEQEWRIFFNKFVQTSAG